MATWYFDADTGSNSTGDGSQGNPWQFYDGKFSSINASDRVLFKRGTLQIIDSIYLAFKTGVAGLPTYYGVYGEGSAPVRWFSNNTWGHLFNGANTRHVTIEDFEFDCSNQSGGSIYWAAQGTSIVSNIIMRRCVAYGSTTGTGITFSKEGSATTASAYDCLIEDCDSYNNGAHGFAATGAYNITFRRCRAWKNGGRNIYGGHGFTARALRQTYTSGWTLVSGNIYSRALNGNESDVYYCTAETIYRRLYKNVGTPTAPAAGEFGVSGGLLYVNMGATPNGLIITYAYSNCTNILFDRCEAFENLYNPVSPYHEGHGFAFDDFTQLSTMRRCYSHDNQGLGISNNRGDGNTYESIVAVRNWQSGFTANPSDNLTIRNNTFVGNNCGVDAHNGEVRISSNAQRNHTIVNNHIEALPAGNTYGIDVDPAATNVVLTKNNIVNCTTPVRAGTESGTTSNNAVLLSSYRPRPGSPLIESGNYLGNLQDKNSTTYWNPPTIGAFEYIRPRTMRS